MKASAKVAPLLDGRMLAQPLDGLSRRIGCQWWQKKAQMTPRAMPGKMSETQCMPRYWMLNRYIARLAMRNVSSSLCLHSLRGMPNSLQCSLLMMRSPRGSPKCRLGTPLSMGSLFVMNSMYQESW